jgi:hypothetical protein
MIFWTSWFTKHTIRRLLLLHAHHITHLTVRVVLPWGVKDYQLGRSERKLRDLQPHLAMCTPSPDIITIL